VVGIMRGELAAQEWSRPGCQVRISKSVACCGPWAPLGHFSHPVSRRNLRVVVGQMRRAASVCAYGITRTTSARSFALVLVISEIAEVGRRLDGL
jgi:hypothetical protein